MRRRWFRAAGAVEIVRPRRLIERFWAAPQIHRWIPACPASALQPLSPRPCRRHLGPARVAEHRTQELQRLRLAVRTTAAVS